MEYHNFAPDLTPLPLFLQHVFFKMLPIISPHTLCKYSNISNKNTVWRTFSKISWAITERENQPYSVICYMSLQCQLHSVRNSKQILPSDLSTWRVVLQHSSDEPSVGNNIIIQLWTQSRFSLIYKFHFTYAAKKSHVLEKYVWYWGTGKEWINKFQHKCFISVFWVSSIINTKWTLQDIWRLRFIKGESKWNLILSPFYFFVV